MTNTYITTKLASMEFSSNNSRKRRCLLVFSFIAISSESLITSKDKDLIIYMAYTDRRLIACQSCFILCFYSWNRNLKLLIPSSEFFEPADSWKSAINESKNVFVLACADIEISGITFKAE